MPLPLAKLAKLLLEGAPAAVEAAAVEAPVVARRASRARSKLLPGATEVGAPIDVPTQLAPAPAPAPAEASVLPGAAPAGSKRAPAAQRGILATPNLRDMAIDEASSAARAQPHLMQDADGQFIGAPRGVMTKRQLAKMRRDFDADVEAGAQGGDWYTRARATNAQWAGNDPARQRLIAREQALWSAQANPDVNMNFQLQAHNAYEMGEPLTRARTGAQAETYRTARDAGEDIRLGKKTGIYGQHLDPTVPHATTGTNDIWHARGFGYTNKDGKLFSRALTPQEHRFLDYETILATDRANAKGLAGRTNWQAHEIQASPWVAGKGRGLAKKKIKKAMTQEEKDAALRAGVAEASKTYPDYADKYTAFGTHEQTPGVMTNHLPDLVTGSLEDRMRYAADPRSSWTGNSGRDALYDEIGLYQREQIPSTGIYTPPGGVQEINPARVARPLVGLQAEGAGLDPASKKAMDLAEGTRAFVDAQGAGAWHKPIFHAPAGKMGSVHIPLPGPLPPDKIAQLQQLGNKYGLGDLVDTGQGLTMTNFDKKLLPGGALTGKNLKAEFGRDLKALLGAEPRRAYVESGYVPMFEKGKTPGSSEVSNEFLKLWDAQPASVQAKLGEGAGIKSKAAANLSRDYELAQRTGQPVREDIQNVRKVLQAGGPALLKQMVRAGKISAASAAALGLTAEAGFASPMPGARPRASVMPGARAVGR